MKQTWNALALSLLLVGCTPAASNLEVALTGLEATTYVSGSLTFNIAVVGGTPDSLELRRDGQLFQVLSGNSFTWNTATTPDGSYTFVARARKSDKTFDSPPRLIVVDHTPPSVTLNATPSATPLVLPGSITLSATASDAGGVPKLEFFNGSNKLGEVATPPYTLNLPLEIANHGTYALSAKVTDRAGNSTQTPVQTLLAFERKTITLTSEAALDGCIVNVYTGYPREYIFAAPSCTYGTSYAILHFFSFDLSSFPLGTQIEKASLQFSLKGVDAIKESRLASISYATPNAAPPVSQEYPYNSSEPETNVSLSPNGFKLADQQSLDVRAMVQDDTAAGRSRSQFRFRTLNSGPGGLGGTIYFAEAGGDKIPKLELQLLLP
jgi:hypothetical protein